MRRNDELGHALIGLGRVAPNHVDGFRAVPWVNLLWACDRDATVAEQFGAEFSIPRSTTELAEVLSDPAVDSVTVAVDHAQHAAIAAAALSAGKHVLVEKPVCLDPGEAEKLRAMAAERQLVFSVVSQHRYDPLVRSVQRWIEAGLLGRLLTFSIQLEAHRPVEYYQDSYWRGTWAQEGGSALVNQGYHCVDIARLLCGPFVVHGATMGHSVLAGVIETEETVAAVLGGPGGLAGTLAVTVVSTDAWRSRITVVGDRGTVEFDLDHPSTLHRCTGDPELERLGRAQRERLVAETAPGVNYYGVSHRHQIADFCNSVRTGEPMHFDSAESLATLELIQTVYRTAAERSEE